jgi:hypothetical protein
MEKVRCIEWLANARLAGAAVAALMLAVLRVQVAMCRTKSLLMFSVDYVLPACLIACSLIMTGG